MPRAGARTLERCPRARTFATAAHCPLRCLRTFAALQRLPATRLPPAKHVCYLPYYRLLSAATPVFAGALLLILPATFFPLVVVTVVSFGTRRVADGSFRAVSLAVRAACGCLFFGCAI
jgi:hypothetical protein